ncbi:MAG: hypothetical protein F6K31_39795 [Symploca sp. SIO2G7]|nr:hypothetical protein [Symploca sp. SIO2G7]
MSTCIPQVYLGIFHEDAGFLSPSMQKPGTRQGKKRLEPLSGMAYTLMLPSPNYSGTVACCLLPVACCLLPFLTIRLILPNPN